MERPADRPHHELVLPNPGSPELCSGVPLSSTFLSSWITGLVYWFTIFLGTVYKQKYCKPLLQTIVVSVLYASVIWCDLGPARLFFRPLLEAVPQQMGYALPIGADPIEGPCRLAETQLLDHIRHSTLQGPKWSKYSDLLSRIKNPVWKCWSQPQIIVIPCGGLHVTIGPPHFQIIYINIARRNLGCFWDTEK